MESLFFRAVLHVILKERLGFVRRYETRQELLFHRASKCLLSALFKTQMKQITQGHTLCMADSKRRGLFGFSLLTTFKPVITVLYGFGNLWHMCQYWYTAA